MKYLLSEHPKADNEVKDVEMGGTASPSHKIMTDITTNTEKRAYEQAAAQTQVKEKGKGPNTPAATPEVWRFRLIPHRGSHLWKT